MTIVIDNTWLTLIGNDAAETTPPVARWIVGLLWSLYLSRSVRVRATFTR